MAFLERSMERGWAGDRREMAEEDVCCGPAGVVTGGQSQGQRLIAETRETTGAPW